jgi:hypothetical protein
MCLDSSRDALSLTPDQALLKGRTQKDVKARACILTKGETRCWMHKKTTQALMA